MKRNAELVVIVHAGLLFAMAACGSAELSTVTPAPTVTADLAVPVEKGRSSQEPLHSAESDPVTRPLEPPKIPEPAPPELTFFDLVDSPGDPRVETAAALIKGSRLFKARVELTKVIGPIDETANLDTRLAAHALLGRTCAALKDTACAETQFGLVRTTWDDPTAGAASLASITGDEATKNVRLARALTAVAEALFYEAEGKRLLANHERFPVYTGKGDREGVFKHVNTKTGPWIKARRKRLDEAVSAYIKIARLLVPPPTWLVASASRVGQMWGQFAAEFRAAPIPKEWQGVGVLPGTDIRREEIRSTYYAAIDAASEPQLERARAAFKMCQDVAKKVGLQNEHTAQCDAWLKKHPDPSP